MLTGVVQDGERALQAVEQAEGLLDDERVSDARRLLRELIGQDFDIDADGDPRFASRHGVRSDHLDGRPRDASRPQEPAISAYGYKLSASTTNTADP
jgi:hypothetical protein